MAAKDKMIFDDKNKTITVGDKVYDAPYILAALARRDTENDRRNETQDALQWAKEHGFEFKTPRRGL